MNYIMLRIFRNLSSKNKININFIESSTNKIHNIKTDKIKSILEIAHDNNINLEGACESSLACSTCHIIIKDKKFFNKIPEASEDELDMLDLAYDLSETSRLGCQIQISSDINDIEIIIPNGSRNNINNS